MKIIAKNTSLVFQSLHQHTYGANMFDNPIDPSALPEGRYPYTTVGAVSKSWIGANGATAATQYSTDYTVSAVAEVSVGDKFIFTGTGFVTSIAAIMIYGCAQIQDGISMTNYSNTNYETCKVLSYSGVAGEGVENVEVTITQAMVDAALAAVPSATKFVIRAYGKSSNTLVLKKILD